LPHAFNDNAATGLLLCPELSVRGFLLTVFSDRYRLSGSPIQPLSKTETDNPATGTSLLTADRAKM
jgi:hypothetical protein